MSHSIPLGNQSGEHIRILVIGNANAGKTTVLEKVCHARGIEPDCFDKDGNKIDVESKPSALRGEHDIENYFQYPTAHGLIIFHDSRGFEAGDPNPLEIVKNFINERAKREQLKDRLHAIWYCLPTSNDRAMTKDEMSLFEIDMGNVPVIAIFTKMDALDVRAFNQLLNDGSSFREARSKASSVAKDIFKRNYLQPLRKVTYKPTYTVQLRDMRKEGTNCDELIRRTSWALDGGTLKLLCLSILENYIEHLGSVEVMNEAAQGKDHVPVKITWQGGGDIVAFASWPGNTECDHSLEGRVLERQSGELSAIVNFPPGTHRFRFLVDGKWCVADDLPKSEDNEGILSNYLVVSHTTNAEDDKQLSLDISNAQSSTLLFLVAVTAAILAY